jgi:PKD repeat protein
MLIGRGAFLLVIIAMATSCGGGGDAPIPITFNAANVCWNGEVLKSTVSQSAANSLYPQSCESQTVSQKLLVGIGAGPNASASANDLVLRNIPSSQVVAASTFYVRDFSGRTFQISISTNPIKVTASPSLPVSTSFTVLDGGVNFENAPTIDFRGKVFSSVFAASIPCWNAEVLTSVDSQSVADSKIPSNCVAFSASTAQRINFEAAADIGSFIPKVALSLINIPSSARLAPSSATIQASNGELFDLSVQENSQVVTSSRQLPFATTFTVVVGALNFSNAIQVNLAGKSFTSAPIPGGPLSVISPIAGPNSVGIPIFFDGSSSLDNEGTLQFFEWSFGDGSIGSGQTVSHTYSSAGSYTVTLTVKNNFGKSSINTSTISVVPLALNQAPVAKIVYFPNVSLGRIGSFSGIPIGFSSSGSADPDGSISSYLWSFGDGSSLVSITGDPVSHTYATQGTYVVSVTVTDNRGASNTATLNNFVVTAP